MQSREESLRHDGRPAASPRQNRKILLAIEGRNPAVAEHRMRNYIRSIEHLTFPAGQPSIGDFKNPPRYARQTL